mgnify:CR=1 FL=1
MWNADLLVDCGMGLKLAGSLTEQAKIDNSKVSGLEIYWEHPCFTVDNFVDKSYRLLTDESFLNVARK